MLNIYQTGISQSNDIYTITALAENNQNGKCAPMDFGHRIETVRVEKGMTREALAEKMGVTPTTIFRKERGSGDDKRGIKADELIEFAKALGCTLDYLLLGKNDSIVNVPLGGKVSGGKWIEAVDTGDGKTIPFFYKKKHADLIALEVEGQSMNKYAPDGHCIIVDRTMKSAIDGARVVAQWDDSVTFKVYRLNPIRLEPDSTEKHDTIFPNGEVHILGHAVGTVRYDKL